MPPAEVIRSLLVFDDKHPLFGTYKVAKRIVIGVVGGTVLALGVVMMVTPGPGLAGIIAGLGILAIEFTWARIWLKKIKSRAQDMARQFRSKNGQQGNPAARDGPPPPATRP
jgi:tellurite resistance protein TerC